jgi:hypothetical protein
MAYIGREPQIGNYQVCDAISVVNGQAAYTMQVSSVNVIPESVNHMIVSLNGVIQNPGSSYTISSSTITFSSNLATGDSIDFIYLLGNTLDLGTPSDSTVTSAKLSGNLVTPGTLDVNGQELILDADADTSITADTDDQIDIKIAGADDFQFTANTFTAQSGSSIVVPDGGLTFGSTAITSTGAELNILDGVTSTAAELNKLDGVGTLKQAGKETIWVPAQAMTPTATNGCSTLQTVETTSGRPDMNVLDFDKDSDEFAQFAIAFPKSWNLGTITFQCFWSGIAATTGVAIGLQGVAMNDNETIDVAYGTAVVVTDDAQSAVEELLVTAESGAVTIAGTPADNDLCYFRIFRDVSDGNDDMAGDMRLHGVKIFFTTDAANDA